MSEQPPLDLSKIKPPSKRPSKRPDRLTQAALDEQIRVAAVERAHLENASFAQDMLQRRSFAVRAFWFVCAWMVGVMLVVLIAGIFGEGVTISGVKIKFGLSEKVLITLLCTTTANVTGLLVIVMRYLFSPPKSLKPAKGNTKLRRKLGEGLD